MAHRFRTITDKGTTTERGYGAAHVKAREHWLTRRAQGDPAATHCAETICLKRSRNLSGIPDRQLHLAHTADRQGYKGLAHAACNLADGARRGQRAAARTRQARQRARTTSWSW